MINCNECNSESEIDESETEIEATVRFQYDVAKPMPVVDNNADVGAAPATAAHMPKAFDFGTTRFEPDAVQSAAAPHFLSAKPRCQQARNTSAIDKIQKSKAKEENATMPTGPCYVEALLVMCTTTLKETFNGKQFFDHFDATYEVKSSLGTVIKIKIPTTIAAALTNTCFSYQWLMAIQNELQQNFADG